MRLISGAPPEAQNPSAPGRSRPPLSCSLMSLRHSFANPPASYPSRVQWHPRDWPGLPHESRLAKRNLGSPSILQSRSRQPRPTPLLSEFESCQDWPSQGVIRNRSGDSLIRRELTGHALVIAWEPLPRIWRGHSFSEAGHLPILGGSETRRFAARLSRCWLAMRCC